MKTSTLILSLSSLTLATPVQRDASDTSNDMDSVIAGNMDCASNAVVFGRGTFDSGNIGVWVGPFLRDGLHEVFNGDVHIQGVNEADYPANLVDYVKEGGSERCADACARTVDIYVSKCSGANIFLSGWSQGALCAHKCINRLSSVSRKNLRGLATFGDENQLMDQPSPIPSGLPSKSYCNEGNTSPDLLCTQTAFSGVDMPSSVSEWKDMVYKKLMLLGDVARNTPQLKAAASIPGAILNEFWDVKGDFLRDVITGNVRRWLVLPPHFVYGNNGMAREAAKWMGSLVGI